MAKREETDCDICGEQCTDNTARLVIPTRWVNDSSGHGGDHNLEKRDLCAKCAGHAITVLLKRLGLAGRNVDYELSKSVLAEIMEGKAKG